MEPFYFEPRPVSFIMNVMSDKTKIEMVDAERAFYAYLDIALRVFEADEAKTANQPIV